MSIPGLFPFHFFSCMTHSGYHFYFIFLYPSTAFSRLLLVKFATNLLCCICTSLRIAVIGGNIFDRAFEQFSSASCRLRHSTAARKLLWDRRGYMVWDGMARSRKDVNDSLPRGTSFETHCSTIRGGVLPGVQIKLGCR